jgi:hypothetical protein
MGWLPQDTAMFSIPRVNVIESDTGYSVEVLGRTGLRYVEGTKSMSIDSEALTGPDGLMVYRSSIRAWDLPSSQEPIDEATRDRILDNIRRAFRFRGFDIQVL